MSGTPVTIIVRRKIKAGQEAEAEAWMHSISDKLGDFSGALGVEVIRPHLGSLEYTYIYRFVDYASLNAWHESEERKEWLRRSDSFMAEPPQYEEITGLEYWFTPPAGNPIGSPAPKRWRQLMVSWVGLAPLSYLFSFTLLPFLRQIFPDMPLVHSVLNLGALLWVASYLWMPRVTRLAHRFLHPAR